MSFLQSGMRRSLIKQASAQKSAQQTQKAKSIRTLKHGRTVSIDFNYRTNSLMNVDSFQSNYSGSQNSPARISYAAEASMAQESSLVASSSFNDTGS